MRDIIKNKNIKTIIAECWAVSWPMMFIMLFVLLIGLADVFIAGRFGKEIQAAYGLAFQIYFVFLILAMALSVGAVSVISRLFTSQNHGVVREAISSSLITAIAVGTIFGILGIVFSGPIIMILRVPESIKSFAVTFISLYSVGIIFHYIMMNTNAILRACKMIRASLWTMLIVCILNIGLNFYLSFHTPLAFKGIAISTVISLIIGSVINISFVIRFTKGISRVSLDIVKRIFHISWPSGLLQIFWQLGAMAVFVILSRLPRYNVETMAAFTNGLKIESMIFLPAFAFNMANSVVVGNLLGKKKEQDAFHGGILTALMGSLIVSVLAAIVMINARTIASLLSDNPLVVDRSVQYIIITLLFEPLMAWGVILAGGLNGAGDTRSVATIVSLSVWLIRIPLSYILALHFAYGAIAVWWSMNISIIIQGFFISKRYFSKRWISISDL